MSRNDTRIGNHVIFLPHALRHGLYLHVSDPKLYLAMSKAINPRDKLRISPKQVHDTYMSAMSQLQSNKKHQGYLKCLLNSQIIIARFC